MASTINDPSKVSWGIAETYAYFDSTISSTYMPADIYDFVFKELLVSSIGFYFDADLGMYVMGCN